MPEDEPSFPQKLAGMPFSENPLLYYKYSSEAEPGDPESFHQALKGNN